MLEQFAGDNYPGLCPEAIAVLLKANQGAAAAYGDHWTQQAADRLRELFENDCKVFFVYSGTTGNSSAETDQNFV
ncbi:MAG: hypothetical protein ACFBSG_10875 [Leptolyngbyaceae cyanobacterium]